MPLVVITAGAVSLRPLLLKLKGADLALLDEADLSGMRLGYRGSSGYTRLQKKDLKSGDGAKLFEEMKALVSRVRAVDAMLESPDWTTFNERSAVVTDRVLALYEETRKYVPRWYVPRPGWHGPEGLFRKFLDSDRSLLAVSGVQGTGKSALAANLAVEAREAGHAVLFTNAQRFTFADVSWTGTPYPAYFSSLLHYSSPFDRAAFARIVKTAEPGKQVVLFIDAINEVDGIESKWNRFRAMELLLEWLVSIAQPGLKVVLSFRVDAYEEYEYLQAEELPPTLGSIAYPGNHPTQPWVIELEPFDETQAEALFHHLQKEPQFGMAPAMGWEEIRAGLGEHLAEFTDNPLLFTILLRVHHRETAGRAVTKQQLFRQYIGRLTGEEEQARRAWPRNLWGFVRNGGVTKHERLISDLLSGMITRGATAIATDQLDASSRLDSRLIASLTDPRRTEFRDLMEGGLLQQEQIEAVRNGTVVVARRVGFVAELLIPAMETISEKLRKVGALRTTSIFALFLGLGVPSLLLAMTRILELWLTPRAVSRGVEPSLLHQFMSEMGRSSSVIVFPFCVVLAIVYSVLFLVLRTPEPGIRDFGLVSSAVASVRRRQVSAHMVRAISLAVVPFLILALLPLPSQTRTEILTSVIAALAAAIALILIIYWSPWGIKTLALRNPSAFPARIMRNYFLALSRWYGMFPDAGRRRKMRVFLVVWIPLVMCGAAFLFLFQPPRSSPHLALSMSEMLIHTARLDGESTTHWATGKLLPPMVLLLGLIIAVLAGTESPVAKVSGRAYRRLADARSPSERSRQTPLVLILLLSMTVAFMATLGVQVSRRHTASLAWLVERGLSKQAIALDSNGQPRGLDLRLFRLTPDDLDRLYRLKRLRMLTFADTMALQVDLRRFRHLRSIQMSAASINHLRDAHLDTLKVTQATSALMLEGNSRLRALSLRQSSLSAVEIVARFPAIRRLQLDEESARWLGPDPFRAVGSAIDGGVQKGQTGSSAAAHWTNLILRISGDGPPHLEWISPAYAHCIFDLAQPPDENTQNLDLIFRLWVSAQGLDPAVLRHASRLQWLVVEYSPKNPVAGAWFSDLREVVEESLPLLNSIDIVGGERHAISAVGREKMLCLLSAIVEDPGSHGIGVVRRDSR
jgi:hypothetical protein